MPCPSWSSVEELCVASRDASTHGWSGELPGSCIPSRPASASGQPAAASTCPRTCIPGPPTPAILEYFLCRDAEVMELSLFVRFERRCIAHCAAEAAAAAGAAWAA